MQEIAKVLDTLNKKEDFIYEIIQFKGRMVQKPLSQTNHCNHQYEETNLLTE
jgi:hypothetical protein